MITEAPVVPASTKPPAVYAPSATSLDGAFVRGMAWTGSVKWLGQLITWASTLLVARLLSPADYGLVGMATVFLGLVTMVSEFGIGAAIVTMRGLERSIIGQLNAFSVWLGVAAFALACLVAVPLGAFFGASELPPVVAAMGVTFIVAALRTVPSAVLQRDLRFKRLALIDGAQGLVQAGGTLVGALAGMRYWSLVLGTVLSAATATILTLRSVPVGYVRPRWRELRTSLTYGGHIIGARVGWQIYSESDRIIAGKLLGRAALGVYQLAWTLASVPIEKVTSLVIAVTPSVFSAVQRDLPALRRYVLNVTEGIALLTFPATIGLGLVARDAVHVLLGSHWAGMVAPLQWLAFYAAVRSLTPVFAPVLNVSGHSRFSMRISLVAAVALPAAFIVGARWGVVGIAIAWIVVHPIVVVAPSAARMFSVLRMRPSEYFGAIWPAVSSVMIMSLAVLGTRIAFAQMGPETRLPIEAVVGAASYSAALLVLHRSRLEGIRGVWRSLRQGQ